ncbi:MAG TPA: hydroxysqualene dehydroxylase HpnE [Burkholderiales bacterium]|nr:hydroxysqualene dehydroxylase HpnE [Burkholderiales bacterium]
MADRVTGIRAAIVGGGYAGMAAAAELSSHGVPVRVFESGRVLGGRARRVETDGHAIDNGLHILLGAYRETLRLVALVSRPDDPPPLLRRPLALAIHPDFALRTPRLPAPLHLLAALLGARGLSPRERLAAARFMAWARLAGFRLASDITVAELLRRKSQPARVSRFLWLPLCVSALNTPPDQASAQVFLNVLRDSLDGRRADSDLLLPAVDFSALFPERAARYVEERGGKVECGATVDTIRRDEDGFELAGGRFSHVVLALSPHRVGALLAAFPELGATAAMVEAFRYQPIYSVYLQYAKHVRLPFAMGGIEARYSQWLFDRGRLCGQHGFVGVVISAAGAHQDLPRDELARAVHAELAQRFAGLGEPLWQQVIAEKRATFACTPGLQRPGNETSVAGLYLAGDYTASDYPATIESAVRSGVRAASLVMQHA